jgi:hypothetical protein
MKNLIAVTLVGVFASGFVVAADKTLPPVEVKAEAPATKKACVKQLDPKTKKEKEVCKTIKVHKKLEVPDQKKELRSKPQKRSIP